MAAPKNLKSVFVGNIPYDATEEKLKDIFSEAGPVVSFRLVYDRDSGKPKGYGFCEYEDAETAASAIRNINGYPLSGRSLRVDGAASERGGGPIPMVSRSERDPLPMEVDRFQDASFPSQPPPPSSQGIGSQEPSVYGPPVAPEEAPDAIKKAMASLPPEQMYELMKQMKLCIRENPEDARRMLLQNPQLAYALLQAQLIMRIIDPKVADAILHKPYSELQPHPQITSLVERPPPPREREKQRPRAPPPPPPQQYHREPPIQPPNSQPGPMMGSSLGGPVRPSDPRAVGMPRSERERERDLAPPPPQAPAPPAPPPAPRPAPVRPDQLESGEQEKAALIMQVLSLSDEQIASLPLDQRQSIISLKTQIARSTGLGN
ncbi:cleavage stimulation factor subunit 2-like [Oscarella lobularis]|uniref:cleavage stimulation factor subunit 2-like n=1 Tax=Oscarella lobularis TaxID=121494 RepID=UPI0033139E8F